MIFFYIINIDKFSVIRKMIIQAKLYINFDIKYIVFTNL